MALQISISNAIGARAVAGGGGIDPDAQAFITASGITDVTQQSAINQLVVDLKGYGIWTKMKALYPFVGGTSSTHKWNLKDPRDLDVAFRLVFSGGWTHSVNGALPNGTNAYAETYLNDLSNLAQNSAHISVYSRTNAGGLLISIGSNTYGQSGGTKLTLNYASQTYYSIHSANQNNSSNTDTRGMFIGNRTASTGTSLMIRGTITTHLENSQTPSNTTFKIGGIGSYFDNKELAFATIGDGLTNTDMTNLTTAVQSFQTTLGRSIGTQTVSDADAQAFVTNAGIVDQVEANAINNLVIGLKADGLWTKMKAVYPFVGGTATTNKFNLVNPLDTDAAFRLVFNGGWTHSSTGATPNGTNGWADTKLVSQGTLGLNSTHVSVYSRSNINNLAPSIGNVTGGANGEVSLWPNYANATYLRVNNPTVSSTVNTDSRGLFIGNRNSSTQINLSIRGTQTTFNQNSNSLYPQPFQLGAVNPNNFDTRQLAFASIGDGLTSQNMTDLTTRVTTFQTALNRNV